MLRFVGRLMGLSLRTRLCLPFQLPGLIWKRILVSPTSLSINRRWFRVEFFSDSRCRLCQPKYTLLPVGGYPVSHLDRDGAFF